MSQFLSRGYHISSDNKIKKMIADGYDWQIYLTNFNSYILAVKPNLYDQWIFDYSLPSGIFLEDKFPNCRVFLSTGNYIISSMEKGPYPVNGGQVEAFSIAFKTSLDIFSSMDLHDAIYIEEYSLLLPVSFTSVKVANSVVYGKWLTGGINISINSFKRVSKIMSWLPKESLIKSAQLAGFILDKEINENEVDSEKDHIEVKKLETKNIEMPITPENGKFVLLGRPDLEQFFNDKIIDIVLHQEQYKRMGILFPGATILFGPPGCGKTYAIERLSEYLKWQRFDIESSTIASSYIHDTSKKISEIFRSAIEAAPSIVVIDEMEAFLTDRSIAGSSAIHHIEEVAEFLRRIPEAISKGVLVFAMTNMLDLIDPAILLRGRFDNIVEVKMPSASEIEALLSFKFSELPVDDSIDTNMIATELAGRAMSDVTFVLQEAGRIAVKRDLDLMNKNCFDYALNLLPKKKERPKMGFVNTDRG